MFTLLTYWIDWFWFLIYSSSLVMLWRMSRQGMFFVCANLCAFQMLVCIMCLSDYKLSAPGEREHGNAWRE